MMSLECMSLIVYLFLKFLYRFTPDTSLVNIHIINIITSMLQLAVNTADLLYMQLLVYIFCCNYRYEHVLFACMRVCHCVCVLICVTYCIVCVCAHTGIYVYYSVCFYCMYICKCVHVCLSSHGKYNRQLRTSSVQFVPLLTEFLEKQLHTYCIVQNVQGPKIFLVFT